MLSKSIYLACFIYGLGAVIAFLVALLIKLTGTFLSRQEKGVQ